MVFAYYLLPQSRIKHKRTLMKIPRKNHREGLTSKQRVELFFNRIIERQRLEEEYYSTGDAILLPEIEKVREDIREIMNELGIKISSIIRII
jgi:hypothetical protein